MLRAGALDDYYLGSKKKEADADAGDNPFGPAQLKADIWARRVAEAADKDAALMVSNALDRAQRYFT